jgi:hypothetical protein
MLSVEITCWRERSETQSHLAGVPSDSGFASCLTTGSGLKFALCRVGMGCYVVLSYCGWVLHGTLRCRGRFKTWWGVSTLLEESSGPFQGPKGWWPLFFHFRLQLLSERKHQKQDASREWNSGIGVWEDFLNLMLCYPSKILFTMKWIL